MSVRSPTAGTWSSSQWRPDNEFETDRPPATRRRLCVLRQRGDQLVAGLEQFLFVDDVVAVEDGAGLVAGVADQKS